VLSQKVVGKKFSYLCDAGEVAGIEHRVLPGGSGWPGRSAFDQSASYMEPGANE